MREYKIVPSAESPWRNAIHASETVPIAHLQEALRRGGVQGELRSTQAGYLYMTIMPTHELLEKLLAVEDNVRMMYRFHLHEFSAVRHEHRIVVLVPIVEWVSMEEMQAFFHWLNDGLHHDVLVSDYRPITAIQELNAELALGVTDGHIYKACWEWVDGDWWQKMQGVQELSQLLVGNLAPK